jgi:hypothetical protein
VKLTLGDFVGHSLNKDAYVIAKAGLTGSYGVALLREPWLQTSCMQRHAQ